MSDVLVRVWDGNFEPVGHIVTKFNDGHFVVPRDHAIFRTIWKATANQRVHVTVEASDEFHWTVREMRDVGDVYCIPWIDGLRASIVPDEKYLAYVALMGS